MARDEIDVDQFYPTAFALRQVREKQGVIDA